VPGTSVCLKTSGTPITARRPPIRSVARHCLISWERGRPGRPGVAGDLPARHAEQGVPNSADPVVSPLRIGMGSLIEPLRRSFCGGFDQRAKPAQPEASRGARGTSANRTSKAAPEPEADGHPPTFCARPCVASLSAVFVDRRHRGSACCSRSTAETPQAELFFKQRTSFENRFLLRLPGETEIRVPGGRDARGPRAAGTAALLDGIGTLRAGFV
jgi:hypothetical protein